MPSSRAATGDFMGIQKLRPQARARGHRRATKRLLDRATGGLYAGLATRTVVDPIAPALRERHVRERLLGRNIVDVNPVSDQWRLRSGERISTRRTDDQFCGAPVC